MKRANSLDYTQTLIKEARRQPRFVATIEPVCEGANHAEREMRTMRWPENTSEALRILVNGSARSA